MRRITITFNDDRELVLGGLLSWCDEQGGGAEIHLSPGAYRSFGAAPMSNGMTISGSYNYEPIEELIDDLTPSRSNYRWWNWRRWL